MLNIHELNRQRTIVCIARDFAILKNDVRVELQIALFDMSVGQPIGKIQKRLEKLRIRVEKT